MPRKNPKVIELEVELAEANSKLRTLRSKLSFKEKLQNTALSELVGLESASQDLIEKTAYSNCLAILRQVI